MLHEFQRNKFKISILEYSTQTTKLRYFLRRFVSRANSAFSVDEI